MDNPDELYPCIGICSADPDSGRCLGCGRPLLETPDTDSVPPAPVETTDDTASPGNSSS